MRYLGLKITRRSSPGMINNLMPIQWLQSQIYGLSTQVKENHLNIVQKKQTQIIISTLMAPSVKADVGRAM